MSSSVTRADVSSWQLQEVTTNPISPSPWRLSTTAKRPDREGDCGTLHSGTQSFRGSGGGEGERGNKGPSLIVGVTFCMSGDPVPARPIPVSPSHPRVLTWLPGTQLIASPYLETLLDFDGVYLGGTINYPIPSSSSSYKACFLIPNPTHYPELPASVCACGEPTRGISISQGGFPKADIPS